MIGAVAARIVRITDLQLVRVTARGERREAHHYSVAVTAALTTDAPPLRAGRLADAVHALAAGTAADGHEAYAQAIARHLAQRVTGVAAVRVDVSGVSWGRVELGGRPRDRDFTALSGSARIARAETSAGRETLHAGIRDLKLLTVQEEGPVTVSLDALWSYGWNDVPFDTQWQQVRRALVESFTERKVDVGEDLARDLAWAVLEQSPAVRAIEISLNAGALEPVNLTGFGMETTRDVVAGVPAWRESYGFSVERSEVET